MKGSERSKGSRWLMSVVVLMISVFLSGQMVMAGNKNKERVPDEEAWKKVPNLKKYLKDKYEIDDNLLFSNLQQTPDGPNGNISFGGKIRPKNIPNVEGKHNRASAIAKALLKEEADLLGIKNMEELREAEYNEEFMEERQVTVINISYSRYIGDLKLDGARFGMTINPDESIAYFGATIVPTPPELYETVKKKTISEEKVKKIVMSDLKALNADYDERNISEIEKVAIATSPYVVWKVKSVWGYTIDAFTGEVLDKRPSRIY